jgi:hypothetical protein
MSNDRMAPKKRSKEVVTREEAERMLGLLKSGRDVRRPKIRRLRSALRSSQYENDLKLEIATDRLLREM